MVRHGFHIVQPSPWPVAVGVSAFSAVTGFVDMFHGKGYLILGLSLCALAGSLGMWWMDVVVEATFLGRHTSLVYSGLRVGMLMFILSEVMFFFTFFWSYIYYSKVMGHVWPPSGIFPVFPYGVPLLNTIVLVSSGFTLTWCQRALSAGKREEALVGLSMTIVLGVFFTGLQIMEFFEAPFSIMDTVYGSIFFVMTGFHGLHVIVGTVFLIVNLFRLYRHHFAPSHHFGFSAAAWYWHFVDIVWLFLWLGVYCLGWNSWVKSFYAHGLASYDAFMAMGD